METKLDLSENDRFKIIVKEVNEKEQSRGLSYLNETVNIVKNIISRDSYDTPKYFVRNVYKHWELPINTFHETIGKEFLMKKTFNVVLHKDDQSSNVYIPNI